MCEGKVTEKVYLASARATLRLPKENVLIESTGGGGPLSIVTEAVQRAEQLQGAKFEEAIDEAWVVFDTEVAESSGAVEAVDLAIRRGLNVVLSNPCFELWLLLHRGDERSSMNAQVAKRKCGQELDIPGRNSRHCKFGDSRLPESWEVAAQRARLTRAEVAALERIAPEPSARVVLRRNPSTNVDEILSMMHAARPGGPM